MRGLLPPYVSSYHYPAWGSPGEVQPSSHSWQEACLAPDCASWSTADCSAWLPLALLLVQGLFFCPPGWSALYIQDVTLTNISPLVSINNLMLSGPAQADLMAISSDWDSWGWWRIWETDESIKSKKTTYAMKQSRSSGRREINIAYILPSTGSRT